MRGQPSCALVVQVVSEGLNTTTTDGFQPVQANELEPRGDPRDLSEKVGAIFSCPDGSAPWMLDNIRQLKAKNSRNRWETGARANLKYIWYTSNMAAPGIAGTLRRLTYGGSRICCSPGRVIMQGGTCHHPQIFNLFTKLKKILAGKRYSNDEEMKEKLEKWPSEVEQSVFGEGIKKLALRLNKCIQVDGDHVVTQRQILEHTL
ncbi:hypothetical protein AAG570_001464 [Ranatra chinensis]|uniref:Uncharacterized protein n=1 Tax=Ranatra chinensis TaxID=642074 RepID=A0ABD0Y8K9_9HEMI